MSTPVGSQKHEAGRKIYNFRCYFCHGYSGDAKTLAASYLDPKPVSFQKISLSDLSREQMLRTVTHGEAGTAMQSFANTLSEEDIALVVDFVRQEFVQNKLKNTRYHTKANGWDNHERYKIAFPFATGVLALDTLDTNLSEQQLRGKRLFMSSCVTCHDRGRVEKETDIWQPKAVSYPRNQYSHKQNADIKSLNSGVPAQKKTDEPRTKFERSTLSISPKPDQANKSDNDSVSAASVFARHEVAPSVGNMTVQEKAGEKLFQANCAFCHGADGSGKNWIGSFLQPSPRNLTDINFMRTMTRVRLKSVIEDGLENTSMPAWKNVLNTEQINQVVAYVFRVFPVEKASIPAGKKE